MEFPAELRVPIESDRLEANALRARARQVDDRTVAIEIDGVAATVALDPPLLEGMVDVWPFAASRTDVVGRRDRIVAAPEHPVIILERRTHAEPHFEIEARSDDGSSGGIGMRIGSTDAARGSIRFEETRTDHGCWLLVACAAADAAGLDARAVQGAAIARSRRRAARRPRVLSSARPTDRLAVAEYELRRLLRREDGRLMVADPRQPARRLDADSVVAVVVGLLALGDEATARALVQECEPDIVEDHRLAALVAGAFAAWRGSVPATAEMPATPAMPTTSALPRPGLRAAAAAWIAGDHDSSDQWTRTAAALSATAAEAMGDGALLTALRTRTLPDARSALSSLAAEVMDNPVLRTGPGAVLHCIHRELGIVPDAPRGRIGLAPALAPGHISVDQVSVGNAVLRLSADCGPNGASIDVEQTSGGIPVTILLEPIIGAERLTSARVDRTPAELDATRDGSGLRVKVQLVADQPRRLELDYDS